MIVHAPDQELVVSASCSAALAGAGTISTSCSDQILQRFKQLLWFHGF